MNKKSEGVNKNSRTVAIAILVAVVIAIGVLVGRDLYLRSPRNITCVDGSHPVIDMREFTTQYWVYSAKLEVSIGEKGKISTELDPKVLAQVSQGLQEANEFRKYIVAGYNSCAITQAQYRQVEPRFKVLDNLAQQIESLLSRNAISEQERTALAALVTQYGDLARQLSSP